MWRPLIEKLKEKFTIIAPDLPGIGDSDIPKSGADMKTAAIRIHALAKSLGITKARVVGHDIGLMVAYAYAARFAVDSKVLFTSEDGEVYAVKPGIRFELLSKSLLGETTLATAAVSENILHCRTRGHVIAIGSAGEKH